MRCAVPYVGIVILKIKEEIFCFEGLKLQILSVKFGYSFSFEAQFD